MDIGNHLEAHFEVQGQPYTYGLDRRLTPPPPETDEVFIHNFCKRLKDAINAIEDANTCMSIVNEELNIETIRSPSTLSNDAFVDLHEADLLEAA